MIFVPRWRCGGQGHAWATGQVVASVYRLLRGRCELSPTRSSSRSVCLLHFLYEGGIGGTAGTPCEPVPAKVVEMKDACRSSSVL